MDVKSRIISEIDDLLSEYTEKRTEKENSVWTSSDDEKDFHAILGAIDALTFLKRQIEGIDVAQHKVIRIVEEPRLCLHFVSGYEYCCEIDESEVPNT